MTTGHVIGETPHEASKRMVRNIPGVGDVGALPDNFHECFYQCTYRHPPLPRPSGPI